MVLKEEEVEIFLRIDGFNFSIVDWVCSRHLKDYLAVGWKEV